MFKLVGAVCIVFATSSYGFQKAKNFRNRTEELRLFQDGLSMLQTEVTYGLTPLPEALRKIGKIVKAPVGDFFQEVFTKLMRGDGNLFTSYWDETLDSFPTALNQEDKEIIRNLGYSLGRSSVSEQKKHIDITLKQLYTAERESKEQCAKNEKMWKYLGFFSGLALVLVLL